MRAVGKAAHPRVNITVEEKEILEELPIEFKNDKSVEIMTPAGHNIF